MAVADVEGKPASILLRPGGREGTRRDASQFDERTNETDAEETEKRQKSGRKRGFFELPELD
jgi:hypothetical protein